MACLSLPSKWTTSQSGGQFAWLFWSQDHFNSYTHCTLNVVGILKSSEESDKISPESYEDLVIHAVICYSG